MKRILNVLIMFFCLQTPVVQLTTSRAYASNPKMETLAEVAGVFSVSATDGTLYSEVQVSWTALGPDFEYEVYRSESPSTLGSPIGKGWQANNNLLDRGVKPNKIYYYRVKYKNTHHATEYSKPDKGYAKQPDTKTASKEFLIDDRIQKIKNYCENIETDYKIPITVICLDTKNDKTTESTIVIESNVLASYISQASCFEVSSETRLMSKKWSSNDDFLQNVITESRLRGVNYIVTTQNKTLKNNNASGENGVYDGFECKILNTQTKRVVFSEFIKTNGDTTYRFKHTENEIDIKYNDLIKEAAITICAKLVDNKENIKFNPINRTTTQINISNSSVRKINEIEILLNSLEDNNMTIKDSNLKDTEGVLERIINVNHAGSVEDLYKFIKNKWSGSVETISIDNDMIFVRLKQ